jgi:hypothetical protein
VKDKLLKKVSESEVKLKKLQIVQPYEVTSVIGQYLNVKSEIVKHYEPQKAELVYYFTKLNEPVEL